MYLEMKIEFWLRGELVWVQGDQVDECLPFELCQLQV